VIFKGLAAAMDQNEAYFGKCPVVSQIFGSCSM
jgi:hypothetical protein